MVIALAILIALGTWQARKVAPKTALLTSIEEGLSAAPIALPVNNLDDFLYRRVYFEGTVFDKEPIGVFGTNLKGKAGYHLYLPVLLPSGRSVIVNFGWVPAHLEAWPDLPRGELVELNGVIQPNAIAGSFTPANDPLKKAWYLADVFVLAEHFDAEQVYPVRIARDHAGAPTNLPRGSQVRIDIPNDHLEYALTWYGLALGLIGVYLVFGFKSGREREN